MSAIFLEIMITYRFESLRTRVTRLEKMDEMLYDDKLVGDITKERYDAKHMGIAKQIEELKDELLIADASTQQRHREAVSLIELTQDAKAQYLDENLSNDAKRTILTKLFDSVTYANNSVSVKYSFLAQSIAQKSAESREILNNAKMPNQTLQSDENNRGQKTKNNAEIALRPVWQGNKDDYQTYCDVI